MAKPRPIIYVVRESKKGFKGKNWKATAYVDGKRKQHWFDSKGDATSFANDKNAELTAYGSQLSDLTATERADSQRALEILRPYPGVTLVDLARDYVPHRNRSINSSRNLKPTCRFGSRKAVYGTEP